MTKREVKRELRRLERSVAWVYERMPETAGRHPLYQINQQLGMAWEYIAQHCKHWETEGEPPSKNISGYRSCKICGEVLD